MWESFQKNLGSFYSPWKDPYWIETLVCKDLGEASNACSVPTCEKDSYWKRNPIYVKPHGKKFAYFLFMCINDYTMEVTIMAKPYLSSFQEHKRTQFWETRMYRIWESVWFFCKSWKTCDST